MILDKNLTMMRRGDTAATTTKAVALGGENVTGNTSGMAPYRGLFLHVAAAQDASNLTVTLEHCDTAGGTFETLKSFGTFATVTEGQKLVDDALPLNTKNWIRLKFSSATVVEANCAADVKKGWPHV